MQQKTTERQKNKINHVGYLCEAHEKILLVIDILLRDKPDSSIVFCNTSECVDFVRKYLQRCGFIVAGARTRRSVVVASDAAVRGARQRYHCVINFDVPMAVRNYTARIGMLARNRNSNCISLLCDYYSDFAPPIIARYRVQCGWPAADLSAYRLPERSTVEGWLELESGKQARRSAAELESGKQAWRSAAELESGKQAWRSLESGKQAWRSLESGKRHGSENNARASASGSRERTRRRGGRAKSAVSYASKKADQIVAQKSQRKSIWERILSFLTRQ